MVRNTRKARKMDGGWYAGASPIAPLSGPSLPGIMSSGSMAPMVTDAFKVNGPNTVTRLKTAPPNNVARIKSTTPNNLATKTTTPNNKLFIKNVSPKIKSPGVIKTTALNNTRKTGSGGVKPPKIGSAGVKTLNKDNILFKRHMDNHGKAHKAHMDAHAFQRARGGVQKLSAADKVKYNTMIQNRNKLAAIEKKGHAELKAYRASQQKTRYKPMKPIKIPGKQQTPKPPGKQQTPKPTKVSSKPSPKSTKVSPKSNSKSIKIAGKQQTPKATRKNQKGGRRSRKTRKNRKNRK